MTDIALAEGDLIIHQTPGGIDILSEENESRLLFERAIRTPLKYLTEFILTSEGVEVVDADFGNGIYEYLSESLSINWVTEARRTVVTAITKVKLSSSIKVQSVDVEVLNPNTAIINIIYSDRNQATRSMQVPIVV